MKLHLHPLLAAPAIAMFSMVLTAAGEDRHPMSDSIYRKSEFLRTLIAQRKAAAGNSTVQITASGTPQNPVKLDFISVRERGERTDLGYGRLQSPAGTYGVEGHGTPGTMFFRNGAPCSPKELARWIRNDPRYSPGTTVYLFACEAGKGQRCFAQKLADELRAKVIAPTEKLWIATGGGYYVAAVKIERVLGFIPAATQYADRSRPGTMRTFQPAGS